MTDQETIQNNVLIAEFMGAKSDTKRIYQFTVRGDQWAKEGLKYHKNWNWLMPVVEKIEGMGYDSCIDSWGKGVIHRAYFSHSSDGARGDTKIEAAWLAVIDFIKKFN